MYIYIYHTHLDVDDLTNAMEKSSQIHSEIDLGLQANACQLHLRLCCKAVHCLCCGWHSLGSGLVPQSLWYNGKGGAFLWKKWVASSQWLSSSINRHVLEVVIRTPGLNV